MRIGHLLRFQARAGGPKTLKAGEALEEALCFGWAKIQEAKRNGQWYAPDPMAVTKEQFAQLAALFKGHEPACTDREAMPLSVKKTYTRAYLDAKTDAGREIRTAWIVDRLDMGLRPM